MYLKSRVACWFSIFREICIVELHSVRARKFVSSYKKVLTHFKVNQDQPSGLSIVGIAYIVSYPPRMPDEIQSNLPPRVSFRKWRQTHKNIGHTWNEIPDLCISRELLPGISVWSTYMLYRRLLGEGERACTISCMEQYNGRNKNSQTSKAGEASEKFWDPLEVNYSSESKNMM